MAEALTEEAITERAIVSYFEAAGKCQISTLYSDRETGEKRRGRTVTLDTEDLELHPEARVLLQEVLRRRGVSNVRHILRVIQSIIS